MTTSSSPGNPDAGRGRQIDTRPAMQRLLDNPFLLLFLGITVPAALYLIWGIMEIASVPVAD